MKSCIALLLFLMATTGQSQISTIPLDNPIASFNAAPISDVNISDKVIASIKNGDFVHPTFSPDGTLLAYSEVLARRDHENTRVLLYNLNTHKPSVLLDSKRAKHYATYSAFVVGMNWRSAKRLEVVISDGDVDSTRLSFDPYTRQLLRERHEEPGVVHLSLIYRKARQRAIALFPAFPRDVLDTALKNSALAVPDKGIILQKNYAGHDDNIWFLDFQSKTIKPLINLSEEFSNAFTGGVSFKTSIIILLTYRQNAYLFLYREGKIKGLGVLHASSVSQIEVKHHSSQRLVFLVRTHEAYERGDNPLFIYDGEQLTRVREYAELYDAEVDSRGQRIAYCYWEGDKRHIIVKGLN